MATEAKSFKTGDFMLSKWEEEIEGEGTETQWLPVRLGNHNDRKWFMGGVLVNQEDGYIDLYAMH